MQKFIVVKKYNIAERPDIQPAKVKMSGYLKKKRSKVGGWRKMWFVLQNQLLLSYSSKEDYEKKLVSFKDVLNLVPGTTVRPLGGFRFTIETTTNIIYTFRCDDSKTCTAWITALVESLSMKMQSKSNENIVSVIPKFHTSLNDINEIQPKPVIRTSTSCDSLYEMKNGKSPKIPIAQNTARILERNGVPTKKINKLQQIEEENESPKRPNSARNFRLHERSLSVNQSDEVSRINQMFRRSISTSVLARPSSSSGSGSLSSSNSSPSEERYRKTTSALLAKELQLRVASMNGLGRSDSCERKYKCSHCKGPKDLNQNAMIADSERTLEDEVQRLSLGDKSAYDSAATTPTVMENQDIGKELARSARQCPHHHRHHHHHNHRQEEGAADDEDDGDDDDDGNYDDDEDIAREAKLPARLSLSSGNVNSLEPIYAVVDLKNKYAQRARMRQMEEQLERERPKSMHVITSDYEEVLNFSHESDDDENIYEPINIPESTQQRHAMWKYFPKFNIETLIEMARTRKKVDLFTTPRRIEHQQPPPPNHQQHQSAFSDIRKKLGNHRKSIKIRMKKLYTKDNHNGRIISPVNNERNAFSDDELDSQGATGSTSGTSDNSLKLSCGQIDSKPAASFVLNEIEKYRRGERHIFGSLSRLKKTRTSLCLDDDAGCKRKFFALAAPKSTPCFHHELRRELTRRSGSKKTACHSKFYD